MALVLHNIQAVFLLFINIIIIIIIIINRFPPESSGYTWIYANDLGHFNPLNTELNPICHLLALLETRQIFYVSRIRVNKYQ